MQDQDTGARNFQAVLTQLKLRHLRVIDALMEAKSVSGAAKILHITQPAVSKALREIEDILGAALFRRGPQGLSLTDYGRIVLMHGRQMQTQLQRMVEEIEAIRAGDSGVVTIGASMVSLPVLVPRALRILRERNLVRVVRIIHEPQEVLVEALLDGRLDFVVGRLTSVDERDRLKQEVLLNEPVALVVGADHPLAGRKELDFAELVEQDWVFPPPQSLSYGAISHLFSQNGFSRPRRHVESMSYLLTRVLLLENHMVAALPHSVVQRDMDLGLLTVLPIEIPQHPVTVGVTLHSGRPVSPQIELVLDCFREAARQHFAPYGGTRDN